MLASQWLLNSAAVQQDAILAGKVVASLGLSACAEQDGVAWRCRCRQLHMILPDFLPKYWLKVVSQPWEGDVTMVLPSLVWQIKKAVSNPTPDELHTAVQVVRTAGLASAILSNDAYADVLNVGYADQVLPLVLGARFRLFCPIAATCSCARASCQ